MSRYKLLFRRDPKAPVERLDFQAEDLSRAFAVAEQESHDKQVELWDDTRCLGRLTPVVEDLLRID